MYYLDTSVLVKNYVIEPDSDKVHAFLTLHLSCFKATLILAELEFASALARSEARGHIRSDSDRKTAFRSFRENWCDMIRINLTDEIFKKACHVIQRHRLRTMDALHLAAALVLRKESEAQVTMATFDKELWKAARKDGLDCWPEDLCVAS